MMMIEEQSQLKYLSEMSYWMRNKYSYFAFGVYRSVIILLIFNFFFSMSCKMCYQFFTIFVVTQMVDRSQTSTSLSVYGHGGLHQLSF